MNSLRFSDKQKERKTVLVFVPHADDEVLMAGGTILRARKELPDIRFKAYLMTDGFEKELREKRKAEFSASCRILGIEAGFLGFELPNTRTVLDYGSSQTRNVSFLDVNEKMVERIAQIIMEEGAGGIIHPHREDWHPDHEATCRLLNGAVFKLSRETTGLQLKLLFGYVWRQMEKPNLVIAHNNEDHETKKRAIYMHCSQLTADAKPGQTTYNRYDAILNANDMSNAVKGPELVFGPSSRDTGAEYAELFDSILVVGSGRRTEPKIFLPTDRLTQDIFLP
jgi:LmbE family N-acetylglucosaminyl deacetylase